MKVLSVSALLLICFFHICTVLSGQDIVRMKRVTGSIAFDGIPSEPAWDSAELFPLTMHRPDFGSDPSENSEVRIGYDDESLWVGARLYMKDPSKILEITRKRDDPPFGYDAFGIILDTFKDNENALAFFTAPTGLRTDFAISNDAVMNGMEQMDIILNFSWNTFWDVKTTRDDKGWSVEMKIPFSSLKFKPEGDMATMGLIVVRNISATVETDTWPAIKPDNGYLSTFKPSLSGTIGIEGAKPERPVYISPYLLGGFSREFSLNGNHSDWEGKEKPEYTVGLDVKYNINSNLTLDLTANTDFAQVEADALQVNMTRYSLFFPEKRRFFQERTSLFDFALGGATDNLFYSRTIGIADGEPVRILGGGRLTGRLGKTDVGILNMQTGQADSVSGQNFGVIRLRKQVINQNSFVGGIFTSRIGLDGYRNFAWGADGIFRLFGEDYVNLKWAQSWDSETGNKLNSMKPAFFLFDWVRRSEKGFAYKLNYSYSGEKFHPASGFVMCGNISGFNGKLLYGWIPEGNTNLFSYNISLNAEQYMRLDDGKLESARMFPGIEFITKSGYFLNLSALLQKEGVREAFNLADSIAIKPREYDFGSLQLIFASPRTNKLSLVELMTGGRFYDGKSIGANSTVTYTASSLFNLTVSYIFNAVRFPGRTINNSLDIHTFNLTALLMFSTKLTASLLTQYSSTEKDLITNFRVRYNPREGNDFYLVYNDYRPVNDRNSIPEAPKYFNKTVMIKYVYTFVL